jgi:hypothetical protein
MGATRLRRIGFGDFRSGGNRNLLFFVLRGRVFCSEPASISPENALARKARRLKNAGLEQS